MFRVYAKGGYYCAKNIDYPARSFAFIDWRNFTARLKEEMEYDAEVSRSPKTIKAFRSGITGRTSIIERRHKKGTCENEY